MKEEGIPPLSIRPISRSNAEAEREKPHPSSTNLAARDGGIPKSPVNVMVFAEKSGDAAADRTEFWACFAGQSVVALLPLVP